MSQYDINDTFNKKRHIRLLKRAKRIQEEEKEIRKPINKQDDDFELYMNNYRQKQNENRRKLLYNLEDLDDYS